ncbi:MAG: hypothetical protein J6X31_10455 [Bacteroidales bacterium]|nr:hypothetical protein [Bacteroidales bacterium]
MDISKTIDPNSLFSPHYLLNYAKIALFYQKITTYLLIFLPEALKFAPTCCPLEQLILSPIAAVWMLLSHSLAAFREDFPPSIIVKGKDIAPLKNVPLFHESIKGSPNEPN